MRIAGYRRRLCVLTWWLSTSRTTYLYTFCAMPWGGDREGLVRVEPRQQGDACARSSEWPRPSECGLFSIDIRHAARMPANSVQWQPATPSVVTGHSGNANTPMSLSLSLRLCMATTGNWHSLYPCWGTRQVCLHSSHPMNVLDSHQGVAIPRILAQVNEALSAFALSR